MVHLSEEVIMAVSKQARDDYEAGLQDADKGAVGQVATDVAVAHPDTKPYYDARAGKALDEDKKEDNEKSSNEKPEDEKEEEDPDSDKDKD
jgi:hypothetical protein